jgi:hypothetical protein
MKNITEVYHHGRMVDGQPDRYVKLYLHPILLDPPLGYHWVGFQIGHLVYGWTEKDMTL